MKFFNLLLIIILHALPGSCDRACSRNTCLNGGTCTVNDETRMFQCECPLGFSGLLCQDNCSLHCVHGSCAKGIFGEETCQCFEGWMGSLCDISVVDNDYCSPKCEDGRRCIQRIDNSYTCEVLEDDTPKCDSSTCRNNGTCVLESNNVKCVCPPGYTGKACEEDINECTLEKCKNGAICENIQGGYKCSCVEGFTGRNCEIALKKTCPSNFCKNEGKCVSDENKLTCICASGYSGEFCEEEEIISDVCKCENPAHECQKINGTNECACPSGYSGQNCDIQNEKPCDIQPCLNGGHCVDDGKNLFTCFCLPQWTGLYCGESVQCLVNGKECQNGGICSFSIAMTSCDCPSGFTGENCETSTTYRSHPTCSDIRCQNGGSCFIDESGDPICKCADGFDPPFCEPKSGCLLNPCQNGGTCQDADGQYFCHCEDGFIGLHCETMVLSTTPYPTDDFSVLTTSQFVPGSSKVYTCEDCVNSKNCLETEKQTMCVCEDGYYGQTCDQKHDKCATMKCSNNQVCKQIHQEDNKKTIAQCSCPTGIFGEKCEMITSATFSAKSLFIHQSSKFSLGTSTFDQLTYELELSFRTTVENTHLASSENILGEKILTIQLIDGFVVFDMLGNSSKIILPLKLNDAQWYTVIISSEPNMSKVTVKTDNGFILFNKEIELGLDVFLTRFGKISSSNYFIGCLADVRIDGELIIFNDNKRAVDIRRGCTRSEQCSRDYCQNDGTCVDHWESSSCKCMPPFLKPNCVHSLPKTTFGHLDQSSIVHLSTTETENHLLRNDVDLSFLMRSSKPDAFLFYLGEKHNSADVLTNYILVKIVDGVVSVRYRTGGRKEIEFHSKNKVDDNNEHYVQIRIDRNKRQIIIDNLVEVDELIHSKLSQEFYVDDIFIGSSPLIESEDQFYKGYLQDIQLNQKSIIIHPTALSVESLGKVEKISNVMEGAISDPVCNKSVCKYGECTEKFNDYVCKCSDGFTGRSCDRMDYCKDAKCLRGSKCVNVENGSYCVFPVTLSNDSKMVYNLKPERNTLINVPQISFSIRTHSLNGHVFSMVYGQNAVKLMLYKRKLLIINKESQKFEPIISDGKWHNIEIMPYAVKVDGVKIVSKSEMFNINNEHEANLFIGKQLSDPVFACLSNFTIGNYPMLSFTKQKIPTSSDSWMLIEKSGVGTGCISTEQCGIYSTCLNGGTCSDVWNKRKCHCPPGFSGDNCEKNIDECDFMDCGKNGFCTDGINNATCVCNSGFSGENCENAEEECFCHNGGKCINTEDGLRCQCQGPWMGEHCNITLTTNCLDSPCKNGNCVQKSNTTFECSCVDGYSGLLCEKQTANECNHYDCNRGHCLMTISGPACQCDFGYTGRFCEKLINQCTSHSCSSRGSCSSIWNGTICDCDENWRGNNCQYHEDYCLDFPCQNDGLCLSSEESSFKCDCQKYYMGSRCELEGSCLKANCVHGECIQQSAEHHTCSCNIGYEGESCDKRIDYCKPGPCLNGGSCENLLTGYKCQCQPGFEGLDCENDIDECALGFCSNGAKCRDRINDYECICDGTGYQGKNCTVDLNECENPENCINGECINTLGGYKCTCRDDFIGPRCSLKNPCIELRADRNISRISCVHGTCVNPVVHIENNKELAKYECSCDHGYTGPNCSQMIKEKSISNLGYLFGPIIVVVIVFIILGCLLLFFVIRGNNAMHGHYSPSSHEFNQNRMIPTVIKLPPQERLI